MRKKSIAASLFLTTLASSALAHEGHIEHVLFGWMHSHVGWEHLVTMLLVGVLVVLARKR